MRAEALRGIVNTQSALLRIQTRSWLKLALTCIIPQLVVTIKNHTDIRTWVWNYPSEVGGIHCISSQPLFFASAVKRNGHVRVIVVADLW